MNRATRTRLAVVFITLLALALRLIDLGTRIAHQDEARVAYWAYRYLQNGVYWYRPVVHGPFLTIVDGWVFGLLGASDFSIRLVVALVGGLLPLSALLFRRRLRESETVALAAVLAATPLFVYFSRFYRNDLLLAAFAFAAVGLFVRAIDTRRPVFVHLGVALFALAIATKENALVYAVAWVGAAALLADRRLLIRRVRGRDLRDSVAELTRRGARGVRRWWPHAVFAVFLFLAIVVFFYAPRGAARLMPAGEPTPTLSATLADPTLLPALVREATLGSWHAFADHWGKGNEKSYLAAAEALLPALRTGALGVLLFGIVGFLLDRYSGKRPRDVVAFSFFWGLASLVGYPVVVANPFPWETIHMAIPFVIPAAVGLAFLGRLALRGLSELRGSGMFDGTTSERSVGWSTFGAALAALLLAATAAHAGLTVYDTSFENPQSADNELVQYAQSSSRMKPLLGDLRGVVRTNDGTDVLFYGDDPGFDGDELAGNESADDTPPAGISWFRRLPLAWYFEADGAVIESTDNATAVRRAVRSDDPPPIVVAFGPANTCSKEYDRAADIEGYLSGYERHEVQRFLHDSGCTISTMEVYVDENASN